ncbi:hypothetical protein BaRGS_00010301 [Batillaria attramentaria]|uniref:G-protein coupled receptors family 2 profile 2 domain-containing protein n=1 Tax=Batillaria attramentaria TaxID=370345 RepID=A0ABD0LFW2_9CAEN
MEAASTKITVPVPSRQRTDQLSAPCHSQALRCVLTVPDTLPDVLSFTWHYLGCMFTHKLYPASIPHRLPHHAISLDEATAIKQCTENGSWYISPQSQQEWTDYTGCVALDNFVALFWVGLVCNIISIILLAPACFIFLYFRSLRHQHRIKLHVCLFSSFILTNALMILWEVIIVNDRLHNQMRESVLHQNSVGCRFLHALTRYSWTTNFLWMWLEGFHLYRLMVHAFAVPRSLVGFYVGGFSK